MAPYAYLPLLLGLVASVRVTTETEETSSADANIMKSCESLLRVYNNAKIELEESVKSGEEVTAAGNVVRLKRATRSMISAKKKQCDWLTDLTSNSHENDVPFLTKALNAKLSARPCGAQAKKYLMAGDFRKAVDAYVATASECPKIDEPESDEESPIEDSMISSVDEGSILDQEEIEENEASLLEQSSGKRIFFEPLIDIGWTSSPTLVKVAIFVLTGITVLINPMLFAAFTFLWITLMLVWYKGFHQPNNNKK
eukprot:TRINITY_DN1849_c0_g1_i1.p1 TRINITY_DN1849_c0_g1~~TRINITY_DN1849_c0_g1_i1.p1  ORF type:complete len:280 (+),score=53.64 TRINITY_DN1849_c0_g1_i1:78-842(+)